MPPGSIRSVVSSAGPGLGRCSASQTEIVGTVRTGRSSSARCSSCLPYKKREEHAGIIDEDHTALHRSRQVTLRTIPFRSATVEIKNPDGSVVFRLDGIEVPEHWSQVAADILAQKYFRKAGVPARLKRVEETQVPSWLWRSVPDETALAELPEAERIGGETRRAPGLRPPRRHLDLLGLEGRLLHDRGRRPRLLRRAPLHARHADGARRTRRNGSTPACTGPTASTAPARATSTSTTETGELDAVRRRPTSIRSRTPASSSRSRTISSTRAASWTCGCARRACSSTARAPAPTSRALRGESEQLSGGGSSSGLMSFLKIGDRAAGAIKSGGTTRRAAKMVVVDVDHPDIEDYIDWKVKEEQKVAALVTGSKICQKRLKADHEGLRQLRGATATTASIPRKNPALKRAITRRQARSACRRTTSCASSSSPARATPTSTSPTYDTDWDSRGLPHRLRPELEQLGARHRRVPRARSRTTATGS